MLDKGSAMSHYLTQPEEIDYFWMIERCDAETAAPDEESVIGNAHHSVGEDFLKSAREAAA